MISTLVVGKNLRNGKYILDRELGKGGFGCSYKATNTMLNQPVVIKTIKPELAKYTNLSDVREEFLNEAQRLIRCYHPNIVRFHDFFSESEVPYIVMDYIPGETLDKIVLPKNPLSEFTAIEYIKQVAEALTIVHQNQLLHRDVKPQNLILRQDNQQVILIDFGIAREVSWGSVQTHTNLVSDGYAPIEQYLPKAKCTPATDVYGLAATLYTLVTAQIPIAATLRHRLPLENPQKIRPELSDEISQAIIKGMGLEIEERPNTISEWLTLLPKTNSNRNRGIKINSLIYLTKTKNKWAHYTKIFQSQVLILNQSKEVCGAFMALMALILGLDYAWLRLQSFSKTQKQPDPIPESKTINSASNNVSDSTRVPDIFLSPHKRNRKTKPILIPNNKSDSTIVPNIFLSPYKLDRQIKPIENISNSGN